MALGQWRNWVTVLALAMGGVAPLYAADETNEPTSGPVWSQWARTASR